MALEREPSLVKKMVLMTVALIDVSMAYAMDLEREPSLVKKMVFSIGTLKNISMADRMEVQKLVYVLLVSKTVQLSYPFQ